MAPRAIDERTAYQLVSMMRDVVQRGTGTAAKVLGREDVGGKTGSTNDHRDAWFGGFGGTYATVVWVGRDNFQSLGYREYGGKAALPIWIEYMRAALKDAPVAANDPPDGMVQATLSQVWAVNSFAAMAPAAAGLGRWMNNIGTTTKPRPVRLPHQSAATRAGRRWNMPFPLTGS